MEETVTTVGPNTHQEGVLHMAKNVIIVKRRDITPNVVIPGFNPSLYVASLERSSMTWSRNPIVLVNTLNLNKIHFGNNVKGFKGNSNVLFDEIDGSNQRILTDLHIQGTSNLKDSNPVSSKHQGPVLKCRFKVDSSAAGNIIPYNVFQELYPSMPKSILKNSINCRMHLVAYNKEEIKQLGTCVLKVNYGGKTLPQEFFVISSKFKPIIGLNASHNLGLLSINCPTY